MERNSKELKRIARENLENKYSMPMLAFVATTGITTLLNLPFTLLQMGSTNGNNIIMYLAELLISIVGVLFTCGMYRIHLLLARGKNVTIEDYLAPIKNHPDRYLIAQVIFIGIESLAFLPLNLGTRWSNSEDIMLTLFAIPLTYGGLILVIYFTLAFATYFLVLTDNETLPPLQVIKKSVSLMKENKGRYFRLSLSFLGIELLGVLSLGIAMLWIQPYIAQTLTLFYLELNGELDGIEYKKHNPEPTVIDQYV